MRFGNVCSIPLGLLVALVSTGALSPEPACADSWSSPLSLERGNLQGGHFVADPPDGHGRYFRIGQNDDSVFYGIGLNPTLDAFWPSYGVNARLREILRSSPGAYNGLLVYEDTQGELEPTGRIGALALVGGVAALLGGLAYDFFPGNARQMVPLYYLGAGGAAVAGGLLYVGAGWLAGQNEMFMNQAIATYNHDTALPAGR